MSDSASLQKTFRQLNVDISSRDYEIKYYSPPDEQENKETYTRVNKHWLSELDKGDLGFCVHITGESAALVDPSQRQVDRTLWMRYENKYNMVSFLSPEYSYENIIDYFNKNWKAKWFNILDALDLISDGIIKLYATREEYEIHYSICNFDEILLQAKHTHPAPAKEIWFLKSQKLFELLDKPSREKINNSKQINPYIFKKYLLSLSDDVSYSILWLLNEEYKMDIGKLNDKINVKKEEVKNHINILLNSKFIKQKDNILEINESGKEYYKILV